VDTVFFRVSVTDPLDRCVTGLNKENFRVDEDKVEQKISSFSEEFSSVSVGILLDTSGSMKTRNNLAAARAALHRFLDEVNPGDEFFLIAFNRDVRLVKNFTQDAASVLSAGPLMLPSGTTARTTAVATPLRKSGNLRKNRTLRFTSLASRANCATDRMKYKQSLN